MSSTLSALSSAAAISVRAILALTMFFFALRSCAVRSFASITAASMPSVSGFTSRGSRGRSSTRGGSTVRKSPAAAFRQEETTRGQSDHFQ